MIDMSEHSQRWIVAVALLIFLIPSIVWLSSIAIASLLALLCVVGIWEWANMVAKKNSSKQRRWYLVCSVLSTLALASFSIYTDYRIILYSAAVWWLLTLHISTMYDRSWCSHSAYRAFLYIHIVIALAACIVAVYLLHTIHWAWLLYVVALVSLSDISAYYIGRRLGKRQLAPTISRKKTKEGLWGALIAVLILSLVCVALFIDNATLWYGVSLVLLSLVACIAGVVGDLTESMAKRCAGMKDSSKLLPGHGGLLDRIDAFIAAAPVFALGILYH